jgi:tRNA A37 methylthiotransferase MiaB
LERQLLQVAVSTDMICGFCGETESEHEATLDLMTRTAFEQAFMFAYSMRERTHAARHLEVAGLPAPLSIRSFRKIY